MTVDSPGAPQVWTASPAEVGDAQWRMLAACLDAAERARAGRFKLQADHDSYVLGHGLRRLVLAQALSTAPGAIAFSRDAHGKPTLVPPARNRIFFSESRTRRRVVCAVTSVGPIGVDVELDRGIADFDLLSRFVALPDPQRRAADLGPDPAGQFFFYWTALEAYWKAIGTGLRSGNPRIGVTKQLSGEFEIGTEGSPPQGRLLPLQRLPGCAIALVLAYPQAHQLAPGATLALREGNQLIHANA